MSDTFTTSLLDRLRAFSALKGLEFYSIYDATSDKQFLIFEDSRSRRFTTSIDGTLMLSDIPENFIFDAICTSVEKELLN